MCKLLQDLVQGFARSDCLRNFKGGQRTEDFPLRNKVFVWDAYGYLDVKEQSDQ